jgi:SpoVK/Ycf46/Vps4 family AAA+-type ATPase
MTELIHDTNKSEMTETEGVHNSEKAKSNKNKQASDENSRNTSLISHFSKLVALTGEDGINEYTLENAKAHLKPITREFGITPVQAVLLAHFLDRYDDPSIYISDITGSIHCTKLEYLQYQDDVQELEDKKLIRSRGGDGRILYSVPTELMNAIRKGEHYKPAEHRNIPLTELFDITDDLFDKNGDEELTYHTLVVEFRNLIKHNPALKFSQKITSLALSDENFVSLMFFCSIFANYSNDRIWLHPFMQIYREKPEIKKRILKTFLDGTHELLKIGMIKKEIADKDESPPSLDSATFRLTDKAKKKLLGELKIKQKRKINEMRDSDGLIRYKSIKSKNLFYNIAETEQINKLSDILIGDNYKAVCKRLADKGMRTGFACLFSGSPGTGKTETVFQLARKTGRDIMKVDIPAIIGSYVGESEKNIKQQFERYRAVVKNHKMTPILLFNEADALFTKRMELGSSNPTVQQMWNAMQNIILEEMETLKGILIATTNMVSNLDKAFERRFLFKIQFEKPNLVNRQSIWQTMLPELSSSDAETLAGNFDFSGGQIENITRKCIMENVLSGREPGLGELVSFCDKELMEKGGKIGFSI